MTKPSQGTTTRPPVTDWTTDWDFLDPRWVEDPFPIWDELRQTCPIAHTERFDGVYLPTRWQDIRDISYDPETFSSRKPAVRENAYDQTIINDDLQQATADFRAFLQRLFERSNDHAG